VSGTWQKYSDGKTGETAKGVHADRWDALGPLGGRSLRYREGKYSCLENCCRPRAWAVSGQAGKSGEERRTGVEGAGNTSELTIYIELRSKI